MLPESTRSQVPQEMGLLTVNRKVVKAVIQRVVSEVPGVIQLGGDSIWKRIMRWLGIKPRPRGIELELAEGEAAMTLTLVVRLGVRVPELAADVRRRVKRSLKEQLGIDVRTVNVYVTSVKSGCGDGTYRDLDPSVGQDVSRHRFGFDDEPAL